MYRDLMVFLFSVAVGLTASGIVANIYRLFGHKPESMSARVGYIAVMVFAGPSVLFDNAVRAWRKKSCSAWAFLLATAIASYWCMALGLIVLSVVVSA